VYCKIHGKASLEFKTGVGKCQPIVVKFVTTHIAKLTINRTMYKCHYINTNGSQ